MNIHREKRIRRRNYNVEVEICGGIKPNVASPEELAEIEKLQEQFHVTRFEKKHSSDLLMRLQVQ